MKSELTSIQHTFPIICGQSIFETNQSVVWLKTEDIQKISMSKYALSF